MVGNNRNLVDYMEYPPCNAYEGFPAKSAQLFHTFLQKVLGAAPQVLGTASLYGTLLMNGRLYGAALRSLR